MADNSNIQIDGLVQQRQELESLLMSNPAMEKKVQKIVRKVLSHVRKDVSQAARNAMGADPRQAYKAVKTAVYRQILGGNVSLLNKRRASGKTSGYEPPRKLRPGQRGGNRVPRGSRTQQVMDYEGSDRIFILRFLNQGTGQRTTGSRGGRIVGANRGRITPRNFFALTSHSAMRKAAGELSQLIDELIKQEMK